MIGVLADALRLGVEEVEVGGPRRGDSEHGTAQDQDQDALGVAVGLDDGGVDNRFRDGL